jgi:hypothetical protein
MSAQQEFDRSNQGASLIYNERQRQWFEEGHDGEADQHRAPELSLAAYAYLQRAAAVLRSPYTAPELLVHPKDFGAWPWDREAFKPGENPVVNLIKAGALIAATIDSLLEIDISSSRGGEVVMDGDGEVTVDKIISQLDPHFVQGVKLAVEMTGEARLGLGASMQIPPAVMDDLEKWLRTQVGSDNVFIIREVTFAGSEKITEQDQLVGVTEGPSGWMIRTGDEDFDVYPVDSATRAVRVHFNLDSQDQIMRERGKDGTFGPMWSVYRVHLADTRRLEQN